MDKGTACPLFEKKNDGFFVLDGELCTKKQTLCVVCIVAASDSLVHLHTVGERGTESRCGFCRHILQKSVRLDSHVREFRTFADGRV